MWGGEIVISLRSSSSGNICKISWNAFVSTSDHIHWQMCKMMVKTSKNNISLKLNWHFLNSVHIWRTLKTLNCKLNKTWLICPMICWWFVNSIDSSIPSIRQFHQFVNSIDSSIPSICRFQQFVDSINSSIPWVRRLHRFVDRFHGSIYYIRPVLLDRK